MPVDLEYAFAFTPPAGRLVAHMETSQAGLGGLRCDAVARTPALERGGDPAGARAVSRDDRQRHGGDSLAGAEIVVEGCARRAVASRLTAWENARLRRPDGRTDRFGDGAMSMVTQWAKTAFLSGLGGVTGGTLTVECPDRTYRYGEPGELDATLTVHDERFFLRALTGSDIGLGESFMDGDWTTPDLVPLVRLMLRNRRVLDGQSRLTGRAAPAGGRRRAPPPGQFPCRESPTHPSALRPRQRVLPPLSRCRSAHVLLRLLRISR